MSLTELIKSLKLSKRLKITCPACECRTSVAKAGLFTEDALTKGAIEFKSRKAEMTVGVMTAPAGEYRGWKQYGQYKYAA